MYDYVENFLSLDEIQLIRDFWSTSKYKYDSHSNNWNTSSEYKTKIVSHIRQVDIIGIPLYKLHFLTEKLHKLFSEYFQDDFRLEGPHYLTKYSIGSFHSSHNDSGVVNNMVRSKVVTLQLSDENDYDGGDLIIGNKKALKKIGTAIIYNPVMQHQVTKIERGVRFAITECAGYLMG